MKLHRVLRSRSGVTANPTGGAVFARKRSFSQSELETLSLFAPLVHATLSDLAITVANRRFGLAPGELACLALAAGGLTAEEIAAETRYTCDTVATYLKLATKKLGAARSSRPCAGSEALCWVVRTRKDEAGAEDQLLPRWVEE